MNREETGIIAVSSSHGIMHAYLVLLPALIPLIGGDLGNLEVIGYLASLVLLFYGFGSLPVGFVADLLSKRKLIMLSMFMCGGGSIIVGLSPSIPVAAFGLIILGIGASLYHPCGYAHMSLVSDDMRGRYMGFQGLGGDLGMAISYLTSSILGSQFGWRNAFIIWGAIGVLMGVADFFLIEDIACEIGAREGPLSTLRKMFGKTDKKTLLLTFLIVIFSGMLWTGVSSFIMVYITDVKLVSLVFAGGLSTLKYTVGSFAMIIGGELSDRIGRKILLMFGYSAFAISLLGLVLALSNIVILLILVIVLGFTFFVTQSPMNALLGDVSTRDTVGVTYGVNFTLKYGIGFFTPAIGGYLATNYSLNAVFYFFAVLSGMAFLFSTVIKEN
jgi:MFS family permease